MVITLVGKIKEAENIKTFIFRPQKPIAWKAGQYLIYSLPHQNEDLRGKMRFFTISKAPFERNVSITTKILKKQSSFKKTLDSLSIGDEIDAKGPDGSFVIGSKNKKYVFIAGGVGITPFRSILKQLEFEKKDYDVTLLYYFGNNEILFKNELDSLKLKKLKINYFISKEISLKEIKDIKGNKTKTYYVSGPDPMVEKTEKILKSLKIPKKNIISDYFSGYEII